MPPLTSSQTETIRTARSNLLLFTTISALDGTIVMLAAAGTFQHLAGALVAGLTVVAGAGAWLSARDGFTCGRHDLRRLLEVALPASAAVFLAVFIGLQLGQARLEILPKIGGLALLLVALQVGGIRLPRATGPLPLPLALVAAGIPLEVLLHWSP